MTKKNEYIKNTLILLFGKFSTQIISFFLLPLYTYHLLANDYGYIELIQTYISLFVPILLLQLDSAVFRFLIDSRNNEKKTSEIISTSFYFVLYSCILFSIIMIFIGQFLKIPYYILIALNIICSILNTYMLSIARGKGNNLNFSISSIISSLTVLLVNLILILGFHFNASSILIAALLGNFLGFIYLFLKENIISLIKKEDYSKDLMKKMLKYALPMIPNSLSWWIVGLLDRTIISSFLGMAVNGIYTVSIKFSNLINSIFSIFSMSWQETASMYIDEEDSPSFFSNMMSNILILFIFISIIIMSFLPFFYPVVIGSEYISSYDYIPILLLGNNLNVAVGLLGGIYVAKKMTKKVAVTTVCAALLNTLINLAFIRHIHLYAACISTVLAYLIMFVYRYIDIKKIINIHFEWKKIIIITTAFILSSILYYYKWTYLSILYGIIFCLFYGYLNKSLFTSLLKQIKKKKNNKKIA